MAYLGVFVPGAPIKKIRWAKEHIVDKEETHDNGQRQLTVTRVDEMPEEIFQGFAMMGCSGTRSGSLPGSSGGQRQGGTFSAGVDKPELTSSSSSSPLAFGFFFR